MNNDNERLNKLYKEEKISKEDLDILKEALQRKKPRGFYFYQIFVNPFQRVAGWSSIGIGFVVIGVMSYIAFKGELHFPGLFDLKLYGDFSGLGVENKRLSVSKILLQNMIIVLLLSLAFYTSALIGKQKGLRYLDFLGTTMMARFPYLIATFLILIFEIAGMKFHVSKPEDMTTYTLALLGFVGFFSIIWIGATYFFAFKESSGLKGKFLWVSFAVCLILIETLTLIINQNFLL